MTKAFSQWCRPNPYFLWMLVEPPNCMRLSLRKVAHNCSLPVLRGRKYGEAAEVHAAFRQRKLHLKHFHFWCIQSNRSRRGFSSRKAAPRRTHLCRVEVKML